MFSLLQYLVPNWQNSLGMIRNHGLLEGGISCHFKFALSTLCCCLEVEAFSYYFRVMLAWLLPCSLICSQASLVMVSCLSNRKVTKTAAWLGKTFGHLPPLEACIGSGFLKARPQGEGFQVRFSSVPLGPVSEVHGVFSNRNLPSGEHPRAIASADYVLGDSQTFLNSTLAGVGIFVR